MACINCEERLMEMSVQNTFCLSPLVEFFDPAKKVVIKETRVVFYKVWHMEVELEYTEGDETISKTIDLGVIS